MNGILAKGALVVAGAAIVALTIMDPAFAQRRGGGMRGGGGFRGGGMSRGMARPSVSRPAGGFNRSANYRPSGGAINRGNTTVINRPANRPINVGDVNVNRGYGWGGGYYGSGCCYHPVARGAAVVAGAAIASAAIGSAAYALPSNCTTVIVNGTTYSQCGSTWYEPQFNGTTTTYVVVSPPQ